MKDITRIHIAKVPYSIELSAKKNLEKYIDALELYTGDHEVMDDIEIRITELLEERGVKKDAVISDADVTAVRKQLGEPKDFMTEESDTEVDVDSLSGSAQRKLYRNLDSALLGGVLAGIGSYFRINALWIRLIFIILSFMSFGLFVLLYIVLWLIIPPARTAAEKLQLAGRQVTLASIREINESGSDVDVERRARIQKRVATIFIGLVGIATAIAATTTLAVVAVNMLQDGQMNGYTSYAPYQLALILAFSAGVLLVILSLLVAFAAFAQKFNKQIWISGVIIMVLGLSSFGGALASTAYEHQLQYDQVLRDTVETKVELPPNFSTIKSIVVDIPQTSNISYVVDDSTTSIKQHALKDAPKPIFTVENNVLKIKFAANGNTNRIADNTVTIYGPRLDSILISNGYVSYSASNQASLKAEVYNASSLTLVASRIDTLNVRTDESAQFSAEEAAIANVKASIYGRSSIELGNIKSLDVINPDVCASSETPQLTVQNIVNNTYVHNNVEVGVQSKDTPCVNIEFGSDRPESAVYSD